MLISLLTTLMISVAQPSGISEPEQILQNGFTFIVQHKNDTHFELTEAENLVDSLDRIGRNPRLSKNFRSKSYFVIAKLSWRIADKVRMKGGAEHGRTAIEAIKESLELDPNNKDAALSYAKTISDITTQNFAVRKLLTSKLAIHLDQEPTDALEHLERLGLQNSEDYLSLKNYLD